MKISPDDVVVWIGIGSNLGQATDHVEQAIVALADEPGLELTARSSLYQTAPMGYVDQPDFINAVIRASCGIGCYLLLDLLQKIERRFGRNRDGMRFGPRSLDLDLLMYADQIVSSPQLELPHPRMHERLFVLEPLAEIEGDLTIPGRGQLSVLKQACLGQRVQRLSAGAVLKAIKWIDYIIVFDTKSVFPVIESLKPNVLVKGGNYSKKACAEKDRIIGEEFVESYGGKVMTAPYVEGISTTELIRRIMVPIPEKTDW